MEGGCPGDCVDRMAMIVNEVREPAEAFSTHARIARVCERFLNVSIPLLGYVAQDVRVADSVRAQKPLLIGYPDSPAARGISDLSVAVVNMLGLPRNTGPGAGNPVPPVLPSRGIGSMVRRLLGFSPEPAVAAEKP
jgi:hypothetical protein